MADLYSSLSSLQWKFLAVFEAFTEPVSLDTAAMLVPLPHAQMFDLLQEAERSGWICRSECGRFTLYDDLPAKAMTRLRRINSRTRLNALISQLQTEGHSNLVGTTAYAGLLEKAGKKKESIEQAIAQYRGFVRNLDRKTSQNEINRVIKELLGLEENGEYALDFIDLVIDLSNRIMSTRRLIALLKKALKSAEKIDDQKRWTLIQFKLGYAYYSEFQVDEAFSALSAGKEKAEALNDSDLMSQSIGYIGLYYHINGKYSLAVEYLERASKADDWDDNIFAFSLAPLYLSLSEAYIGRLHRAVGRMDYLSRYGRIPGNDRLEAVLKSFAKYSLALFLFLLGKREEPERFLQELRRTNTVDSAQLNFYILKTLGYLYMKTGRISEGMELWNESFKKWHRRQSQGQYVSALILELLTSIEADGHKIPEGWSFDEQYPSIENGPNLHLKGVALRMKSARVLEHDKKAAIGYLQESEKCLLQTDDKFQLSITRLEMTRLAGDTTPSEKSRKGVDPLFSAEYGIHLLLQRDKALVKESDAGREHTDAADDKLMDDLFKLLGGLCPCLTVNEAVNQILSVVSDYFGAERACFFKLDKDILKLTELTHSLYISRDEVVSADFYPCMANIKKCCKTNTPQVFRKNASVEVNGRREPRLYICIPLTVNKWLSGVLYFDNVYLNISIDETKEKVLNRLGPQLALYLEQVRLLAGSVKSARDIEMLKSAELRRQRSPDMIYQSREMSHVVRKAGRMASSEATILIHGETGVGKEMMARWLHENCPLRESPFVTIDFATIPESLLESELFGHEKGSFTGADQKKIGLIELAHTGTLFIDEIGEIPMHLQVKLLRVIQEKQFFRVGGIKPVESDFRLLVATNRDLSKEVLAGRFRQDLYYRLNVLNIEIPPLRERPSDISALARHFFSVYKKKHGRSSLILLPEHEEMLNSYDWPGNIRELKNAIERSVLASEDDRLEIDLQIHSVSRVYHPFDDEPTLDELQKMYIRHMLDKHKGRIGGPKGVARVLGLKRTSLYARMKKLGIQNTNAI